MIEIENSELGAVTKIELFKYLAEIVANGSFAKEHPGGYFFVAHALCYKGCKLPLLVGEPELGIIKALAARNKLRQPVHHRFAMPLKSCLRIYPFAPILSAFTMYSSSEKVVR